MTADQRDWRWTNFPVPEAHLSVAAVSVVLGLVWPRTLSLNGPWRWVVGLFLAMLGFGLMIWATASAGKVRLADPNQLVTTGPYRFSRHPMYLGWTLVYLALIFILNSAWLLILFPALAVWVHLESSREEGRLVGRFGDAYVEYQGEVRRYL